MSLIDEVITSVDGDRQAVEEVGALIAGSLQLAEELLGSLERLGVNAAGHPLSTAKATLDECEVQCAALGRQFEEARSAAEAALGGSAGSA